MSGFADPAGAKGSYLIEARGLCEQLARFDLVPLDRRYLLKWNDLIARQAVINDLQMIWLRECVDSYAKPGPAVTKSLRSHRSAMTPTAAQYASVG